MPHRGGPSLRSAAAVVLTLLAGGCGEPGGPANERDADIARAADEARNSVDAYARQRAAVRERRRSRPAATSSPATSDSVTTARFACDGLGAIRVRFDNRTDTARLRLADGQVAWLAVRRSAEGVWYAGEGFEFHGEGREATLLRPGAEAVTCTAVN